MISDVFLFIILERYCNIILKEGCLDKMEEPSQTVSSSTNFTEKIMELAKIVKETAIEFSLPYNEYKTIWKAIAEHYNQLKVLGKNPSLA